MYPTSANYKAAIKGSNRLLNIAGTITLIDDTVIILNKDNTLGGVSLKEQCVSSSSLDIGSVYSNEFTIHLLAETENIYEYSGARIEPQFGIYTETGDFEYVPLGVFYVIDPRRQNNGIYLTAADGMTLLEKDLENVLTSGTPQALIQSLCLQCGVTLATTDFSVFANAAYTFTIPENSGIETCRDLLMWVCQILCAFARFNRTGSLEIIPVAGRAPVRTIDKDERYTTEISDFDIAVTKVSTTIAGAKYIAGTDRMELTLQDNPLLRSKSSEDIQSVLNGILTKVSTCQYRPVKISIIGDPSLQAGDFVKLTNTRIGDVTTYITNSNWTFRGAHQIQGAGQDNAASKKFSQSGKQAAAMAAEAKAVRELATAANQSAQMLNNTIGGYVLKRRGELLIMDAEDPENATKIWRWNQNGLGYSDNVTGADNPEREYRIAITADGAINGAFLAVNSVLAESISQAYKEQVTDEINGKAIELRQLFETESGSLRSLIQQISDTLQEETTLRETTVSELRQTLDAFTFTFTTQYTGGMNLIQNSAGLNGVDDSWTTTGTVTTMQDSDTKNSTVSNSCFCLHSISTLSQEITTGVAGSQYTITLKYKVPVMPLANTKIYIIHDGITEYIVNSGSAVPDWTEASLTFTLISGTITLNAENADQNVYISDIMLIQGANKARWTPAPNEIYTDRVKIDKNGVEVTNSQTLQKTVMTHKEFAGYYEDKKVFWFNKDETRMARAVLENDMTIGKLQFIPRPNQSEGLDIVLLD